MTTEIATNCDPNQQKQQQQHKQTTHDPTSTLTSTTTTTTQDSTNTELVSPTNQINIKYPLENSWSFWFFKNERSKDWKDNLVFITTVDFVEDFWGVYNHLQPVSKLSYGCDYMFFKKDIQPMWEDVQNRDGGRWLFNIDRKNRPQPIDVYWLNTLLALIGDQFYDESPFVNGAVINLRPKGDKLSLWTRCADDINLQNRIGERFREVLSLKEKVLTFEKHDGK